MRTLLPLLVVPLFAACGAASINKPPTRLTLEAVRGPGADVGVAEGPVSPRAMTRERLEEAVTRIAIVTEGGGGVIAAVYDEVAMLVVSDVTMDRMRIVSPIVEVSELSEGEIRVMMEANFHSTLDARYATSEGVLYSAFIHPLSALDEREIGSAMRQVAALVRNFRSTWSSDELIFGGGGSAPDVSPVL